MIHMKNVKYINSDESDPAASALTTAFGSAAAKICQEEGGTLEVNTMLLKLFTSESQITYEAYPIDVDMKCALTLLAASMEDLAAQMNVSVSESTILIKSKPDSITALPNRAIMFDVDIPGGGTRTYIMTRMKFDGNLSQKMNNKDEWYLPINAFATSSSQLQIVESA